MGDNHLFPEEFRFGGGINLVDAPDVLGAAQQTRVAENFRLTGRGWMSTRKAALELIDVTGWTPAAIIPYNQKSGVGGVILEWNRSSAVRLVTVDGAGGSRSVVGTLPGYETGVSSFPEFTYAVIGRVLFIADVARTRGMVVYDPNNALGGATMQSGFSSGSQEPLKGQTIVGDSSGATAVVTWVSAVLGGGSWVGGDASGFIRIGLASVVGTFQSGENISIQGGTSNVLTLNGTFGIDANPLFQPTFDFNSDGTFAVAKPRVILEHENHLHMFGYGDESEPDRPELWRFSFLGIVDDLQGSGDAGGAGAVTGSAGLFDIDDVAPLTARGGAVVSAGSAPGRLGVATGDPHRYAVIYGTGRDTWRKDVLDTERGSVATRAMIEADGVLYHWSPLGPCFYAGGGQLIDISRPVDPRTEEIDLDSLFAVHFPQENQVRWYYRRRGDTTAGADRWIGWNYLEQGYEEDVLGYRAFCAGWLLPEGTEGPAADPSGLTHEAITRSSARARWTPGDTAPGVVTRVYRALDVGGSAGTYTQIAELGPGATELTHVGLDPGEEYWTKVEHFRNGQVSNAVEESFTTEALPFIPVPVVSLRVLSIPLDVGVWTLAIFVSWDDGGVVEEAFTYKLERQIAGGGWVEIAPALDGHSYQDRGVTAGSLYEYRVTAVHPDGTEGTVSSVASATPQNPPYQGWPDDRLSGMV